MKPESLQALIIDRHFGELSPEAEELLELHLASNATARAEAERILETLTVTRETVMRHPELARVAPVAAPVPQPRRRFLAPAMPLLARAAALVLLAAVAGAGGFMAGRSQTPYALPAADPPPAPMLAQTAPPKPGPWAQYRMSFNPTGEGMQIVRVDTTNLERKSNP